MTKTGRRALFLLVATVANMLLTLILIVLVFIALNGLAIAVGLNAAGVIIIVSFVGAVLLSGFIYSRVLKALRKRPDLEARFGLLK
jgi:hypothetical protein